MSDNEIFIHCSNKEDLVDQIGNKEVDLTLRDQSGSKDDKSRASDQGSSKTVSTENEKTDKSGKLRKHIRRRKSSSSHSSSSSKSSSDESEDEKHRPSKKRRKLNENIFYVVTNEEEHEYCLPERIVDYIKHYSGKYISDKELKEKILLKDPVPTNIKAVPHLDEFIKEIMKDERKNNEILVDSVLEKVQNNTRDVFGPISRNGNTLMV